MSFLHGLRMAFILERIISSDEVLYAARRRQSLASVACWPYTSWMGIHLTQVTPSCRILGNGRLSPESGRVRGAFRQRAGEFCREYLCQLRWPEGFRCPRCGLVTTAIGRCGRRCWSARGCGHSQEWLGEPASVWHNMPGSPTPASHPSRVGFEPSVVPALTSQKNGASPARPGISSRVLGLRQLQDGLDAEACCTSLRRAMVRPGRDQCLRGRVEPPH